MISILLIFVYYFCVQGFHTIKFLRVQAVPGFQVVLGLV